MSQVSLQKNGKGLALKLDELRLIAKAVRQSAGNKMAISFSVNIVTPRQIKKLNKMYRGRAKVTDILSFPAEGVKGEKEKELGDIILCEKKIKIDAKKNAQTIRQREALLMVHGLTHLFGHEHKNGSQAARMLRVEKAAMRKLIIQLRLKTTTEELYEEIEA